MREGHHVLLGTIAQELTLLHPEKVNRLTIRHETYEEGEEEKEEAE
jgi:hypothetical protein